MRREARHSLDEVELASIYSRAEVVVIGDELLSGKVVETNSTDIARLLGEIGIEVARVVRVGDDEAAIKRALASALVLSRLIFVVGGLGVTPDDRTLSAVSEVLDCKLTLHQPTLRSIQMEFARRGKRVTNLVRRHALVLEGAKVFPNQLGLVPGMVLEHQGSTIVLLPGVPEELRALLQTGILPYLREKFPPGAFFEKTLRTFGVIEAKIAPKIIRIGKKFPGVSVGFYPSVAGVDIILRGEEKELVKRCADLVAQILKERVYAASFLSFPREGGPTGKKELTEVVGELLRKRKLTLATAESCTGGLIGDLLTNVPGSSDYFLGGVVAYANETKMKLLGVKKKTLARYGAVSAQTVREMVEGVCRLFNTDVGIAVSGIAGPTGGTAKKPVGLVYIGVKAKDLCRVERHIFSGNRRMIKELSAFTALDLCRRTLVALTEKG